MPCLDAVLLDQAVLDRPVDLAVDLGQLLALHRVQGAAPQFDDAVGDRVGAAASDVLGGLGVVLALDVQRRRLPAAGQPHRPLAGEVVADLPDGPDRVVQAEVAELDALLDHLQHQVRAAHLEQRGHLGHVRVADDDVQPAVALGVRVRLVAGVDDRAGPGGRAGDALPDVLGALRQAVDGAARRLQDLAGAADQLPGDQERQQDVGDPGELARPADQVVLVAAVGVAGRVGVVLEQEDVAADALVGEPRSASTSRSSRIRSPALSCVTSWAGRHIRRWRTRGASPRRGTAGSRCAGTRSTNAPRTPPAGTGTGPPRPGTAALPVERAGDPELGLDTEDPPLHSSTLGVSGRFHACAVRG